MVDCSKTWDALTPGDAVRCVYGSISNGATKAFDGISGVTLGDWLTYTMIAVWFPSVLAAFILPLIFVGRGFGRYVQHDRYEETIEGKGRWKFWSIYLFIAGVVTFVISKSEPFMIGLSAVQIGCAAVQANDKCECDTLF